jgi:hypothetical protein
MGGLPIVSEPRESLRGRRRLRESSAGFFGDTGTTGIGVACGAGIVAAGAGTGIGAARRGLASGFGVGGVFLF